MLLKHKSMARSWTRLKVMFLECCSNHTQNFAATLVRYRRNQDDTKNREKESKMMLYIGIHLLVELMIAVKQILAQVKLAVCFSWTMAGESARTRRVI